jgi:hypothetical protein
MNLRRPFPLLLLSLTLLAGATACDRVSVSVSKPQADGSAEADRTREMEDKAADLERRATEIQNMEGSEQDKIDALNQLEKDRQELNDMSEGSSPGN